MSIALWFSVLFHVVLLSIHFEQDLKKFKDQLPILQVVLVNSKTQSKPENTEVTVKYDPQRRQ